ncbi:DUF898 family protein [Szabonella alba]|uniref:DUF898 family protein n=1 Tax=Szabonella alba TaxID=2804194 RepID=A0A8K0VEN9_9RHOB|nr:DUF898 family protein [Szabonella alba]MBL4918410.1 DUF898 family protein [Szabonella alba]
MSQGNGTVRYDGERGALFKLAMKTGLLTVVTLGIYRFWAKTRIRKYVWSAASLDGDRFEYTGTGLEKLLGFLIAVVFLAIYLGIVQLLLTFVGLGFSLEPQSQWEVIAQILSIYISFFAIVPFLFFATYRAQRYKLARTRFRGIRFGMDNAAGGYVWRAIVHWILTILTLGILLPRQTFWLGKYMTDRSHYGDARFEQGGRWQDLYGAMKHVFIAIVILVLAAVAGGVLNSGVLAAVLGVVGYIWLIVGFVAYGVQSWAYMTSNMTLDGKVGFIATPATGQVLKRFILGGLIVGLIAAVGFAALAAIFAGTMQMAAYGMGPGIATIVVMAVAYLLLIVALGALSLVFITQPITAYLCERLEVQNVRALDAVHQRAADKGADAEGFADALDMGGAF